MKTIKELQAELEKIGYKRTTAALYMQVKKFLKETTHYKTISNKYILINRNGMKKLIKYNKRPRAYLEKRAK